MATSKNARRTAKQRLERLRQRLYWIGRYELDVCPRCESGADFFAVGANGVCLKCDGKMIPLSIAARRRMAKAGRRITPAKLGV